MKKKYYIFVLMMLVIGMSFMVASCSSDNDENNVDSKEEVNGIKLIDGIYYNINSDTKSAEIAKYLYKKYSGDIVIPSSVTFEGLNYSSKCVQWMQRFDVHNHP